MTRQDRPGVGIDDRHPADFGTRLEPCLLHGVDFPEVVGRLGLGPDRPGPLRASGPVDPLLLKGALQSAWRRDHRGLEDLEQLDADSAGAPGRVPPFELTGPAQDAGMMSRRGPPALTIGDGQTILATTAEGTPEGADRDAGQVKIGGDLCEGLSVEVTADDLLAYDQGDGARHGWTSGLLEREYPRTLPMPNPRGYNFVSRLGGIT
jgi:hypothetical protein